MFLDVAVNTASTAVQIYIIELNSYNRFFFQMFFGWNVNTNLTENQAGGGSANYDAPRQFIWLTQKEPLSANWSTINTLSISGLSRNTIHTKYSRDTERPDATMVPTMSCWGSDWILKTGVMCAYDMCAT